MSLLGCDCCWWSFAVCSSGSTTTCCTSRLPRSRSSEIGRFERFFSQPRPMHIGPAACRLLMLICDLWWDGCLAGAVLIELSMMGWSGGLVLFRNIDRLFDGSKWLKNVWRFFDELLPVDAIDRLWRWKKEAEEKAAYSSRQNINTVSARGSFLSLDASIHIACVLRSFCCWLSIFLALSCALALALFP